MKTISNKRANAAFSPDTISAVGKKKHYHDSV